MGKKETKEKKNKTMFRAGVDTRSSTFELQPPGTKCKGARKRVYVCRKTKTMDVKKMEEDEENKLRIKGN